jgi:acetate kinase
MAASLGGVDQIALSGGIGANDPSLLAQLQQSMAWLGAVRWTPIPADEEGMIARLILQQDRLSRADRGSDAGGD